MPPSPTNYPSKSFINDDAGCLARPEYKSDNQDRSHANGKHQQHRQECHHSCKNEVASQVKEIKHDHVLRTATVALLEAPALRPNGGAHRPNAVMPPADTARRAN